MTMHRRPLGMGRLLAAVGAVLILIASFLAWYTAGGDAGGLSPISCNAFDGRCGTAGGMIDFIVALLVLGLLALPYAIGDRPVAVDRGLSFGLLTALGWLALAYALVSFLTQGDLTGLRPDRAPGTWLAVIGLIVLSRATYLISRGGDRI
jgi:hypothetical protein